MIRVLHTADIHIGVENYSRTDPTTGLPTRLLDFLNVLDEAVDFALANDIDLFIVAGDAYKSRDPSQTHQRELAKRIIRLTENNVSVFLLVGNHDLPNAVGRATSLEIFPTLAVPKTMIGNSLESYPVETKNGPIQIVAVPWVRRANLLTGAETRGLSFEQINQKIQDLLAQRLLNLAKDLDPDIPAILTGHITVETATVGSERSMMLGTDYTLSPSNLALPEFEYCALGHIHRTQTLWEDPHLIYSGSLQRVDFSEENDPKGFYVLDIEPTLPQGKRLQNVHFEEVNARRFITIDVNLKDSLHEPTAHVIKTIEENYVENAVVRLRLQLAASQESLLNENAIRRALDSSAFVASISRDVERPTRIRLGRDMTAETLSPIQALELYLDSRESSNQDRKDLLDAARLLIENEEESS
ncbi:MAG: exonuclease SbcCD subunit D [SAR202 cluster bacterium]|nr:exonuclease SbcCD subunit D [SAR202 cluster bacterium]|tara:strand:- start:1119 stop:2363 length:1245 start_codon:yes stop_codon:yes gene_type:complete